MSETNETPQAPTPNAAAADPLLDRNATLAELTAHWESLASKPGTVEAGRVVEVGESELVVEVAAGRGRVAVSELRGARPAVGETLRVFIEQVLADGPVLSLIKARGLDLYDRLEAAADRDEPVEGVVLARVKGGLSVDVGLKAFLPDRRTDAPQGEGQEGSPGLAAFQSTKSSGSRLCGSISMRSPARRSDRDFPESLPYPTNFATA